MGLTRPYISSGGSSLIALALTWGFALGLTRKRPRAATKRAAESVAESEQEDSASARGQAA
jgi:cell division protein FtsW